MNPFLQDTVKLQVEARFTASEKIKLLGKAIMSAWHCF